MLDSIRIVLVRPSGPANVGAVCRAMTNFGLRDLTLVAPTCDLRHEQAIGFAARARPLLKAARVVQTIAQALDGCVATFAASGKGGMYRRQAGVNAHEAAAIAAERAPLGRVAIAFGPEDHGLTHAEVLEFDRVLEIPTAADYGALNLAAAVAVVCYELRMASLSETRAERPIAGPDGGRSGDGTDGGRRRRAGEQPAPDERKAILFQKLFASLERIGFFRGQQNPDHLRFALRRVLGRADMTVNELDIFIGLAQQIDWFAGHATDAAKEAGSSYSVRSTRDDTPVGGERE